MNSLLHASARPRAPGRSRLHRAARLLVVSLGLSATLLATARAQSTCTTDADCAPLTSNGSPLYCVDGACKPLAGAGEFCIAHADCASFAVLGTAACTESCGIAAACGPLGAIGSATARCCAGVPANGTCTAARPRLAQCVSGLQCLAVVSGGGSGSVAQLLSEGSKAAWAAVSGGESPLAARTAAAADPAAVCGKQSSNRWLIGVFISVGGSIVLNLGLNIQKFGFRKNAILPEEEQLPAYKLPLWVFGFCIWIIGNLANFVALSFAAQSLIASLGAVSLVSNAVAAPLINGEPFGVFDLISIVFIAGGTTVVVLFSNHDETSYGLCALMKFYTQPSVIVFLAVMCSALVVMWIFIRAMESNKKRISLSRRNSSLSTTHRTSRPGSPLIPGTPTGLHSSAKDDARRCKCSVTKLLRLDRLTLTEDSVAMRVLLPFSYASMGGVLGGLTVMFAKSAAELISMTTQGQNQFDNIATYGILAGILVTGVGQVYYINQGLSRYDALLQVPCFYVVYTLASIVSGGVYFNEFATFSSFQFIMFIVGVSLTFVGVAFLTGRLRSSGDPDEPVVEAAEPYDAAAFGVSFSGSDPTVVIHGGPHDDDDDDDDLKHHHHRATVSPIPPAGATNTLAGAADLRKRPAAHSRGASQSGNQHHHTTHNAVGPAVLNPDQVDEDIMVVPGSDGGLVRHRVIGVSPGPQSDAGGSDDDEDGSEIPGGVVGGGSYRAGHARVASHATDASLGGGSRGASPARSPVPRGGRGQSLP
ncbi:hypothetical protein H9P43_008372 [Blastocladiella emersonii ATCC 22665]|nr:hypothetical protein H9P43_008372 [Blastocladiella emersonii ATCC 22665]